MSIFGDDERTEPTVGATDAGQYVTFICSGQNYGIDILSVREIRTWSPVTAIPNQGRVALGVLDIRGEIVSVYDLALLLGLPLSNKAHDQQVILVASLRDRDVGLLVDNVSDIVFAAGDQFRPVPKMVGAGGDGSLRAVLKHDDDLVGVLDLDFLFPGTASAAA